MRLPLLLFGGIAMHQPLGTKRRYFERIDSTHRYAMREGMNLEHGTLIIADYQEQGRGRLGRSWNAPADSSLLVSVVVKPPLAMNHCPQLAHVMSLAATRTLRAQGLVVNLRWPNDLVYHGKKIAGMLSEAGLDGDRPAFVVLSAGINLNQTGQELALIDRPSTSCFVETGHRWERDDVLEEFINQLNDLYPRVVECGFPSIKAECEALNSLTGSTITLDLGGRTVKGVVLGLDDEGRVVINDGNSATSFVAGEVMRVETNTL